MLLSSKQAQPLLPAAAASILVAPHIHVHVRATDENIVRHQSSCFLTGQVRSGLEYAHNYEVYSGTRSLKS